MESYGEKEKGVEGEPSSNASYISARLGTISFLGRCLFVLVRKITIKNKRSWKSISNIANLFQSHKQGRRVLSETNPTELIDWAQDPCQPSEQEMWEASPLRRQTPICLLERAILGIIPEISACPEHTFVCGCQVEGSTQQTRRSWAEGETPSGCLHCCHKDFPVLC